ncbi:MAG: hypothetical protein GX489_06290 [Firmicutes bacterium]|nr:hypothetical protein [Bacillota bacterium]
MKPKPTEANIWWHGFKVGSLTLGLSLLVGFFSGYVVRAVPLFLAFLVLLAIVALGILFDIMGVAVTAAEEPPLHAMAAKKVPGAREAVRLLRHAPAVSNFCNDMVGDMAGTLSGATGATIVFSLITRYPKIKEEWLTLLVVASISALTVGGKAVSKHYSLQQANAITLMMGRGLLLLEKIIGRELLVSKTNSGGKK